MLKRIILFNFIVGSLIILLCPPTIVEYKVDSTPKPLPIAIKAPTKKVIHKKQPFVIPQGKAKEMALYVARETNVPLDKVTKIMWAESRYQCATSKKNKNGTFDHCYFQINDIHKPEAERMGLNIDDPEDNAEFAIHLIKESGLTPWGYSKKTWSNI